MYRSRSRLSKTTHIRVEIRSFEVVYPYADHDFGGAELYAQSITDIKPLAQTMI